MPNVAAVLLLTACGGEGGTEPVTDPAVGRYALATVNGAPLPYASQATPLQPLLADTIQLSADGFWSRITVQTTPLIGPGGTTVYQPVRRFAEGVWSRNGTAITLGGTGAPYTLESNTLRLDAPDPGNPFGRIVLVYPRVP